MKKTTFSLVAAALLVSSHAHAEINIQPTCDVHLNGKMHYENAELTIETDSGDVITFNSSQEVLVDGKRLSLSSTEREHAKNYYEAVKEAVPLTVDIAVDGIELASETIGEVFSELLGPDDSLSQEVDTLFVDVRAELENHFQTKQGGFTLNGEDVQHDGWFTNTWESKFEQRVDNLIAKSMGRVMLSLGSSFLFGGEESSNMLSKSENIDATIEQGMELKAKRIESKAEVLCAIIAKADKAENALQASNAKLAGLNTIKINKDYAK